MITINIIHTTSFPINENNNKPDKQNIYSF